MLSGQKTILIVEDEISLLHALRDKLAREGFAVLEAKNGKEGLGIALREHPDLILLDIIMPVMDGITMLKKLRHDLWGVQAAVMILTNLSDAEDVLMRSDKDPLDYLVKTDWKLEDVAAKVKEVLGA
ncbi:MAG: hypothetical protein A3C82_02370 [Candidatus Wildermuthbacteria bacterium RIFCSPHIGHO2_02_FULL_47_12]|uniref:Response regulatory domain-containing protein n=1 Tax=Candidatus Wildermuthbacteria bacterium RIFCSPHIGHO2_02_FULL_47_12 TaxID=1802451 RepID=A0A1G2R301_9BACT|nr:MAG: hypothetical protein A3C82_02370 [Candidatus Wildermuthbacteria bacterium RIFCSPHIGHO2_02_FULL_47_12]